jgi:hypothetical protein
MDAPAPKIKNPNVVIPLTDLVRTMRSQHLLDDPSHSGMACRVLEFLSYYNHPAHIPLLVEWATDKGHPTAEIAMYSLATLAGLPVKRHNADAWRLWLESNKSVLDKRYNLSSREGIIVWLEASEKAGAETQKILMNLWTFESTIPEEALIEEAKDNIIARNVLGDLWHKDRLSLPARRTLVKQHLSFHLVRVPTALDSPVGNFFSVQIAAKSDFPFPASAILRFRGAIALNAEPNSDHIIPQACACMESQSARTYQVSAVFTTIWIS